MVGTLHNANLYIRYRWPNGRSLTELADIFWGNPRATVVSATIYIHIWWNWLQRRLIFITIFQRLKTTFKSTLNCYDFAGHPVSYAIFETKKTKVWMRGPSSKLLMSHIRLMSQYVWIYKYLNIQFLQFLQFLHFSWRKRFNRNTSGLLNSKFQKTIFEI